MNEIFFNKFYFELNLIEISIYVEIFFNKFCFELNLFEISIYVNRI